MFVGLFLGALKICGIRRWPVSDDWLSRPDGASFVGVIAERDDEIENDVFVLVPRFWVRARGVHLVTFLKDANGIGIDSGPGICAGAKRLESTFAESTDEIFAEDTASTVAGAQE